MTHWKKTVTKRQLSPDPIISRKVHVDISDLPSQYNDGIETFRQVLNMNIPDSRDSMPVSSTLVKCLNEVA